MNIVYHYYLLQGNIGYMQMIKFGNVFKIKINGIILRLILIFIRIGVWSGNAKRI